MLSYNVCAHDTKQDAIISVGEQLHSLNGV